MKPPHSDYIDRLDTVIAMLGSTDQSDVLVFHREDSDPAYRRTRAEAQRAEAAQAQRDREALEAFRQTQGSVAAMRELADAELSAVQQERLRLEHAFEALRAQQNELAAMHAERTALEAARSLNEADLHALNERTAALAGEAGRLAELSREAEAAAARTRAEQQKLLDERKALDHERCRWRDERDAQVQAELGRQQAAARAESERDRAAIEKQRKGVIAADQDRARQVLAQLIPVIAPSRDVDNLPRRLKPLPNLPYPPVLVEVQCGSFLPGGAARGADPATLLHLGYRFAIGEFSFTRMEWLCYQNLLRQPGLTKENFAKHFKENAPDMRPVVDISWRELHDDVLPWLNKRTGLDRLPLRYQLRLPTEVEWEYTARAGRAAPLSALAPASALNALAPVDQCRPNAWGIFGMLGNVREWTLSAYGSNASTPNAPDWQLIDRTREQMTLGLAWDETAQTARRTDRRSKNVDTKEANLGFRLAITLPEYGAFDDVGSISDPLRSIERLALS